VVAWALARSSGELAVITSSPTQPGTIERWLPASDARERVAWPMARYIESVRVAEPVELSLAGPDGGEVHGWLLLPEGRGPHPMLLAIHGGPFVQFGRSFVHELQLYAARGYAVLYANPRGSQGYGAAFASAIHRDWGGPAMRDLMAAVEFALANHPIDPDRLGVLGGSYGGYMTNWIVAHTARFRAACTMRTVSSMEAMIWSDLGFVLGDELGALPWEEPELYERLSPITYAAQIETPLLILHGLADQCTPPDQGERLYTKLRLLGKRVEMVLFPGATHDLSRSGPPRQRVERLRVILDWFDRHLMRLRG
jgi:dipeptidyl aminopeptidase/acylaminoacyl peptidase